MLATYLVFARLSPAQIPNQVPVGARPLSMGEAFVAVADDGNAIYWNPAGLARLERVQMSFSYANLLGAGIKSYYGSFLSRLYPVPFLTDYLTVGADWSEITTGDEELDFKRDQLNFSLAVQPPKRWTFLRHLSLGANAKYLKIEGKLDGRPEARASGWGWDLGLLYNLSALPHVPEGFDFGLMVHDGNGTRVKHHTGVIETVQFENIRWGLSYRPFEDWPWQSKVPLSNPVLALDFDDRVHLGLEFWLARVLALRAGWQKDRHTDEKAILSFGLGLQLDPKDWADANQNEAWARLLIDVPLTDSREMTNSKQFGFSLITKEDPRLIRLEGANGNEVFASLYPFYKKRGSNLGVIKLKNVYDESLKVSISFLVGEYTSKQVSSDTVIVIKPDSTVGQEIRARFTRAILLSDEKSLSGEIKVTYEYKNSRYGLAAPLHFALREKNYLTWDDPARAAAFVTPVDPAAMKFSSKVLYQLPAAAALISSNVSHAMALFEGMAASGLQYRLDPVLPFTKILKTTTYFDRVQYPSEILRRDNLQGDCDDLAVLYASLLENAGIQTAIISVPQHLFMMFDTGLPVNQRYRFRVDDRMLVLRNGTIWLPVETTWIDSSFAKAWQEGIERYRQAERNSLLGIFSVNEAQLKYEPTPPDPAADSMYAFKAPPLAAIEKNAATVKAWNDVFVTALQKNSDDLSALNKLGIVYAQRREPAAAQACLAKALQLDPQYAPALNNLANLYFIEDNFKMAENYYRQATAVDTAAAGIYLNLAMLYHFYKNFAAADSIRLEQLENSAWAEAGRRLKKDAGRAFELLGVPVEPDEDELPTKAGMQPKKLWKILRKKFYGVFELKGPDRERTKQQAGPKAGEKNADWDIVLWWSS